MWLTAFIIILITIILAQQIGEKVTEDKIRLTLFRSKCFKTAKKNGASLLGLKQREILEKKKSPQKFPGLARFYIKRRSRTAHRVDILTDFLDRALTKQFEL